MKIIDLISALTHTTVEVKVDIVDINMKTLVPAGTHQTELVTVEKHNLRDTFMRKFVLYAQINGQEVKIIEYCRTEREFCDYINTFLKPNKITK